jgi:hypothetical protein
MPVLRLIEPTPRRPTPHCAALADSPQFGVELKKERNGIDFDSNHENGCCNQHLEIEDLMARVNGSRLTSSPA